MIKDETLESERPSPLIFILRQAVHPFTKRLQIHGVLVVVVHKGHWVSSFFYRCPNSHLECRDVK